MMESDKLNEELSFLKAEVERERQKRVLAEKLLEEKSTELLQSNQELRSLNATLEKNILRRTNTLASLIKNLHTGVLLEDENNRIILINEKFCEIFNLEYNPEILIGQEGCETTGSVKDLFEDPDEFEQNVMQRVGAKESFVGEILKMKDGRVLERDFLPTYSGDEYMGHLWQYREITEQFYFEEKIRESEEKYRGIIENMELGLLEVDANYNIIKAYNWFCGMTGYAEEELIGENAIDLFLPEKYHSLIQEQDEKRKKGEQGVYEIQMRRKDGEMIWVLVGAVPFYDSQGNFTGSIGVHYNITNRKQLEDELREAREIAERSREAEKQFLANMSHEIRNPINAIAGIINLMYDTELSEEQLDYLNNIKYAADILLGLISDILDLSKIEAGKMEVTEKPVDLSEIIRALVQTYNFKTSNKDLSFFTSIDPRLTEPVIAAPTVVNQILLNLLGNAVKFTERGNITVSAIVREETESSIEVEMVISDTGIGITEDQIGRIFDTFHQADKEIKLKYGGTGLGLAIVRQLLSFYDGTINVKSEYGKGSSFIFTMKFKKAKNLMLQEEEKASEVLATDQINNVLIVEDNSINQKYLMGLLKKWGFKYDLADNGQEALVLLEDKTYDVILMDIRMPVMDGYETTIRIRNAEHNPNQHVPIVALTASALVDEKERALAAGMNFHLTKPFSPDQLSLALNHIRPLLTKQEVPNDGFRFIDGLDADYLSEFYEDDLDRAAIMFQIFLDHIHKEVNQVKALHEQSEWSELSALAHRIKPNFAMVGLTNFTEILQEIEQHAKNQDIGTLEEIVPSFVRNFENKVKLVEKQLASLNDYISE